MKSYLWLKGGSEFPVWESKYGTVNSSRALVPLVLYRAPQNKFSAKQYSHYFNLLFCEYLASTAV